MENEIQKYLEANKIDLDRELLEDSIFTFGMVVYHTDENGQMRIVKPLSEEWWKALDEAKKQKTTNQ